MCDVGGGTRTTRGSRTGRGEGHGAHDRDKGDDGCGHIGRPRPDRLFHSPALDTTTPTLSDLGTLWAIGILKESILTPPPTLSDLGTILWAIGILKESILISWECSLRFAAVSRAIAASLCSEGGVVEWGGRRFGYRRQKPVSSSSR